MAERILITGGAGFIGSHLADELLAQGSQVRVLDSLLPQVHGAEAVRPGYLAAEVELQIGDVRDPVAVGRALEGVDAVVHLAAAVGVGQSMYRIHEYTSVNNLGTCVLLEALAARPVRKLVVASSMSIYGEGLYQGEDGPIEAAERPLAQLKNRDWEVRDAAGAALRPIPTPESKRPALPSVYAIGKYDQEQLCLTVGRAYGIPTVALRFFNVYGPRQALCNPYTGVLAIFASRYLNNQPPLINEDGQQQRDFVSVHDIARACALALSAPEAADRVFNIGSGQRFAIREVANQLGWILNRRDLVPELTGKYRVGDIRNCFADITLARRVLGYEPRVGFKEGLAALAEWLPAQVATDSVAAACQELEHRNLTV